MRQELKDEQSDVSHSAPLGQHLGALLALQGVARSRLMEEPARSRRKDPVPVKINGVPLPPRAAVLQPGRSRAAGSNALLKNGPRTGEKVVVLRKERGVAGSSPRARYVRLRNSVWLIRRRMASRRAACMESRAVVRPAVVDLRCRAAARCACRGARASVWRNSEKLFASRWDLVIRWTLLGRILTTCCCPCCS